MQYRGQPEPSLLLGWRLGNLTRGHSQPQQPEHDPVERARGVCRHQSFPLPRHDLLELVPKGRRLVPEEQPFQAAQPSQRPRSAARTPG